MNTPELGSWIIHWPRATLPTLAFKDSEELAREAVVNDCEPSQPSPSDNEVD
jgi:hypothetical protein